METTAGIFRHIHELGRSSPLRWILARVLARPSESESHAAPEERWQDLFWEHAPRARGAALRLQATPAVQTDLFGWLAPDPPASPAAPVARLARPAAANPTRSRAEVLAKPAVVGSIRKRRIAVASVAGYADRRRQVRRDEIARLLEVNSGVAGIKPAPAVKLPVARFSARVGLWTARPVGTPFVMGN